MAHCTVGLKIGAADLNLLRNPWGITNFLINVLKRLVQ